MNASELNNNATATSVMRVPRKKREGVDDDPYPETWDSFDDGSTNNENTINNYDDLHNAHSYEKHDENGSINSANEAPYMKTILPKPPNNIDNNDLPDGVIIPTTVTPDLLNSFKHKILQVCVHN